MMRYLSQPEVLDLHQRIRVISGGAEGVPDLGALESSPMLLFYSTRAEGLPKARVRAHMETSPAMSTSQAKGTSFSP